MICVFGFLVGGNLDRYLDVFVMEVIGGLW